MKKPSNINNIKFKMLASGYPRFEFPESLLEEVDLSDFYKAEEDRFPLYIGTQFGIFPRDFPVESFEGKRVAVLGKSLLSGHQAGICIYEIREGKRIEVQKISLEGPKWEGENLKRYNDEPVERAMIKIPGFYVYEIWFHLELIRNKYRGFSLPEAYNQAIITAYNDFMIFGYENRDSDWISFLRSDQGEDYLNLFSLLDKAIRALDPASKGLPLPLENVLQLFRNIRNPFRNRCKKFFALPVEEDILLLSDFGLCVYYNNFINVNSHEAKMTQNEILEEFRNRDFYLKSEYLFRNQANPIVIERIQGIPVLRVNDEIPHRAEKDIPPMEDGAGNAQLIYERYYGGHNKFTDVQLVNVLNKEIGIRYWGLGRAAVIKAIKAQLKNREIDTSSISDDQSFSLAYCVVLKNKKLIRLGELPKDNLSLILKCYLQKCYPENRLKNVTIIFYDLEKIQIRNGEDRSIYEIPVNDLLKKKGEMKTNKKPDQQ